MAIDYDAAARSLINRGYALIQDDGSLAPMARRAFAEGEAFFGQALETKNAASCPSRLEGFRPMGAEFSQTLEFPDLCESFSVWPWNDSLPEIRVWATHNALHDALTTALPRYSVVANGVLEALRHRINPTAQNIDTSEASYLQINHYRPKDFGREFLQESHEDGHILTIHKATGPALEISVGGQFTSANVGDDQFLLLPGNLLTLLTGGAIAPLFHRVRNDRMTAIRQSLLYFVNPSTTEETLPWVINATNRGTSIREVASSCIGAR